MDDLTPLPIRPVHIPTEVPPKPPETNQGKPRPRRAPKEDRPEVEAVEDLIDSGDDDDHSVDCYVASSEETIEETKNAYLQSLVSGLEAWTELELAVGRGCEAVVKMDLDELHEQIAIQARLSSLIHRLNSEQTELTQQLEGNHSARTDHPEVLSLKSRIEECKSRVRDRNRVQGRLTTHASQVAQRMSNALVRFFTTYPAPQTGGIGPGR